MKKIMTWLRNLFKPGVDVYMKIDGKWVSLGELSRSEKRSKRRERRAINSLLRTISKGHVPVEKINDLADRGVPIWQILSKTKMM